MGKGTISAGGTEGRYTVDLDFGDAERDALAAVQTARIARLTSDIVAMQAAYDAALAVEAARRADVNAAVNAYVLATQTSQNSEDWADELKAWEAAQKAHLLAQSQSAPLRIQRDLLTSQKAQAEKEQARLQNLTLTESRNAWCVDLTEDGTGEVATIEAKGETDLILIAAGCRPPTSGDGIVTSRYVQTGPQVYFNAAILPGWQRHLPTYRTGVISNIDFTSHTATVTLDAATSSAQTLNINPANPVLLDVPVEYMDCDSGAFEEGDNVVVMFPTRDFTGPTVIGFVSYPKSCNWGQGWSIGSGHYVRRNDASPYIWRPDMGATGNVSWTGTGGVGTTVRTVSWHGRVGKHVGKFITANSVSVYYIGREYYFPFPVHGAFAEEDDDGVLWIYAQCRDHVTLPSTGEKLYKIRHDQPQTVGVAVLVQTWAPLTYSASLGGYYNESRSNYCSVFWNSTASAAVGMVWVSTTWPYNLVRYDRNGTMEEEVTYTGAISGGSGNETYVLGAEFVDDAEVQCVVTRSDTGGYVGEIYYSSGTASATINDVEVLQTSYNTDSHISGTPPLWDLTGEMSSALFIAVDIASSAVSYVKDERLLDDGDVTQIVSVVVCGETVGTGTRLSTTTALSGGTSIGIDGTALVTETKPVGSFHFAYGRGEYIGQFMSPAVTVSVIGTTLNFNGDWTWALNSAVTPDNITAAGGTAWPSFSAVGVV